MPELAELPVIKYPIADAAIDTLAEEYMPLMIRDVDDAEGFNLVHGARMDIKGRRVLIEKKRKELKADALEYGRKVDGEAKRLTALLEPIETHLQDEEDRYNAEKERIKREAEEARREKLQKRMDTLATVGFYTATPENVESLTDDEFADLYRVNWERWEEKKASEAAEAEARRVEAEKLAAERAELEAERKRQEAEAAKLRAEQERVEAEKRKLAAEAAERQRQAELEAARKEAAERAKREAEEEQRRKEEQAKLQAVAEEAERKRIEALRPDREKLLVVAGKVRELGLPQVTASSAAALMKVSKVLDSAADSIEEIANSLIVKKG